MKPYGNITKGWAEIGGKRNYFKSKWEANYAAYLQFLKEQGEIEDWEYEPDKFWFDGIKSGTTNYTPDFRITEKGKVWYAEVKGYMDAKSKTKLKRMAKYHPDIDLRLVGKKEINEISKHKALIKDWGKLG